MSCDFSKLTALITTCGNAKATSRLLRSLGRTCPGLKALVATQEELTDEAVTAVKVPDLSDANGCRNALLARVRTPYILLLNDTLELSGKSKIAELLAPIAAGDFDLVAGELQRCTRSLLVFTKREAATSHGTIEKRLTPGGEQVTFAASESNGKEVTKCDFTQSFYVARTDKLRALGGWTSASLFDEREEFFLRAKRFGFRVGVLPTAIASWWGTPESASSEQREARSLAMADLGVSQLVDCQGNTLQIEQEPLAQAA